MFDRVAQGAVDVIRGDQPLTEEHVSEVAELLSQTLRRGHPFVVLDLEKVPLLDSAGLEWLLDAKETLQQLGGSLKVAAPNPLCAEILSITGVGDGLEIYREVLAALGSFVR
jgi:anti-anti-sigma factor